MPKEKLNKLLVGKVGESLNKIMKERSGAAVTKKEEDRLKNSLGEEHTPATAGAGVGALSGSAMTEKEFKKIKKALQQAPEGLEDEALQPGQEYGMKEAAAQGVQGAVGEVVGRKKGGIVRGGRSEIKGTRPAKLY